MSWKHSPGSKFVNHRTHAFYFPSFGDHCLSLPNSSHLGNCSFCVLLVFLVVLGGRVNLGPIFMLEKFSAFHLEIILGLLKVAKIVEFLCISYPASFYNNI